MAAFHPLLLAVTLTIVAAQACAPVAKDSTSSKMIGAADFEAAISRFEAHDLQSPEALNARFE